MMEGIRNLHNLVTVNNCCNYVMLIVNCNIASTKYLSHVIILCFSTS